MADISLRLPFSGDYPVTFGFGAASDNEEIKKKFTQWGISGHHGLDYGWGQSLYAHFKETKVSQDQDVEAGDPIGLSGQTGAAFGEHLHFAIKANDSDTNNGYLGFIDPSSYFGKPQETKPPPEKTTSPPPPEVKEVVREVIKEVPELVNKARAQKKQDNLNKIKHRYQLFN